MNADKKMVSTQVVIARSREAFATKPRTRPPDIGDCFAEFTLSVANVLATLAPAVTQVQV